MSLCCKIISVLNGKTLSTAESCTGGMIGAALTAVPGSSNVYKGGIICYTNEVKYRLLGVFKELLSEEGAVSAPVACEMARGVRNTLRTDFAISVTGLAGPGGDEYGNPVGTVFVGYSDAVDTFSREFHFKGTREEVRIQATQAALHLLYEQVNKDA